MATMRDFVAFTDLAPLFAAGFDHLACRELCEAASGFKLTRAHASARQLPVLRAFCRRLGLSCYPSRFAVQDGIREEGKGGWSNTGRRSPQGNIRYCYVSRSKSQALEARRIEHEGGDAAHEKMAELLQIPECCAEFFVRHRALATHRYADDYALVTLSQTASCSAFPWRANYLAQYFGYSLIHHYPCRWDCSATVLRATRSLRILRRISSIWAATFEYNMRGVVLFENLRAVHFIRHSPSGGAVDFKPHELRSTSSTPLARALRRECRLRWRNPHSFFVGAEAWRQREDVAVLAFD